MKKVIFDFSVEELKTWLYYNPDTGLFTWLKRSGGKCNMDEGRAGRASSKRYIQITFMKKQCMVHRLAYFYMTGEQPEVVDHINHNIKDNRFINLRAATYRKNAQYKHKATKVKFKGVNYKKDHKKFRAQIMVNSKSIHLGYFNTEEQAHDAYCNAAIKYFGEFAKF